MSKHECFYGKKNIRSTKVSHEWNGNIIAHYCRYYSITAVTMTYQMRDPPDTLLLTAVDICTIDSKIGLTEQFIITVNNYH